MRQGGHVAEVKNAITARWVFSVLWKDEGLLQMWIGADMVEVDGVEVPDGLGPAPAACAATACRRAEASAGFGEAAAAAAAA